MIKVLLLQGPVLHGFHLAKSPCSPFKRGDIKVLCFLVAITNFMFPSGLNKSPLILVYQEP